jgi:hypothetical protein
MIVVVFPVPGGPYTNKKLLLGMFNTLDKISI